MLEGMSFALEPGAALILRGPNGSGKTTLLRTLAGLQPSDAGEITAEPDAMAYAGHADALKGTLTAEENLRFWAGMFGASDIGPAIEAFDLGSLRHRPVQNLSAGQKRRLGLARLAVTGRPVWLLDEPTVSLDDRAVAQFGGMVRAHLRQGGSAIIATHTDLEIDAETLQLEFYRPKGRAVASDPFEGAFA